MGRPHRDRNSHRGVSWVSAYLECSLAIEGWVKFLHEGREMGWTGTSRHLALEDRARRQFLFRIHRFRLMGLNELSRPVHELRSKTKQTHINTATH